MVIFWNKKKLNKYIDKRLVKMINKLSNNNDQEQDEQNIEYPKIVKIKGFKSNSASEQFEEDMK
jgi:hypothetical protein